MALHASRRAATFLAAALAIIGCTSKSTVAPVAVTPPPSGTPGTWQDLGLSNGFVEVLALTTWSGSLIAGGSFHDVDGFPSTSLASWNGSSWTRLGPEFGGGVSALAVYNAHLIVGGNFPHINGDPIQFVGEWDGATWKPLASGPNRSVFSLTVYGGDLIAGGAFDSVGAVPAANIARWDGASWQPLGGGLNGVPWALTVYKGQLIAGGSFNRADGSLAPGIAAWNGVSWSSLGGGVGGGFGGNPYGTVYALGVHGDSLIAGGGFSSAGGVPANHVASWNGARWDSLAGGLGPSTSDYVKAFGEYRDTLVAGGTFAGNVRMWDGHAWKPMSYLNGSVSALTMYYGSLIAGGFFPKDPGYNANGIARWVK